MHNIGCPPKKPPTNRFNVFRIENVDDYFAAQILLRDGSVRLPHGPQSLVVLEPLELPERPVGKKSPNDRVIFWPGDLCEWSGG